MKPPGMEYFLQMALRVSPLCTREAPCQGETSYVSSATVCGARTRVGSVGRSSGDKDDGVKEEEDAMAARLWFSGALLRRR